MAGIKITGKFITNDPADTYPLLGDDTLEGGLRVVDTVTDRDAIPDLRRKWGMFVFVNADSTLYQLIDQGNGDLADNTNWVVSDVGGGLKSILYTTYRVTSPYQANESIDITTGNGASSGTAEAIRSATITLGDTQADFEQDNTLSVYLNGAKLEKTVDVNYIDSTHLSFNIPLYEDDIFELQKFGG